MRAPEQAASLRDFATALKGRRVAIVYSHRFGSDPAQGWYHRWRTNVIGMFSQAVEHCGAIPVFFDVDQWLRFCASPDAKIGFAINLNAGNRSLDQWSLAPALGAWAGIPVFPCSGFTASLGEAKDIAKILARDSGWHTPRDSRNGLPVDADVIRKPRTYGSSVGLERLTAGQATELEDRDFIIEEFVRGYDATIVTLHSAVSGRLECLGAQAMIPAVEDPADWVYDAFEKRNPGVKTHVEFPLCAVDRELELRAVHLTEAFGGRFLSRIDVRVKSKPEPSKPIAFGDCVFLEINPMPTIGPSNSVTEFAARFVEEFADHPELSWIAPLTASRIERGAIYILSSGLSVISSR